MSAGAGELQLDGLVGPTHNSAGQALCAVAAPDDPRFLANPKAAALQGLAKMRLVAGLGLRQGVLPPPERPVS